MNQALGWSGFPYGDLSVLVGKGFEKLLEVLSNNNHCLLFSKSKFLLKNYKITQPLRMDRSVYHYNTIQYNTIISINSVFYY